MKPHGSTDDGPEDFGHEPAFHVQMADYDGNTFDAAVCKRCGVVYVPEDGE